MIAKQTYKKHSKILKYLIKRYSKIYEVEKDLKKQKSLYIIINTLKRTIQSLNDYDRKNLYALNKIENDFIDILNQNYNALNQVITKEKILKMKEIF